MVEDKTLKDTEEMKGPEAETSENPYAQTDSERTPVSAEQTENAAPEPGEAQPSREQPDTSLYDRLYAEVSGYESDPRPNIMGKTQMRAEKRRPDPGIPRLIRKKRKPDLRMDPKQMPAERKPEPDRRKKQRKLLRSRKRERQIRNRNQQGTLQEPGRSRSMETAFFSSLQERQNIAGNRQFFPELTTNI